MSLAKHRPRRHNPRTMTVFLRQIPLAAATLFLLFVFSATSRSQSMSGFRAQEREKDATPASVKAARGQAPLSKLYGHLKADAAKIKRLAPLKRTDKAKRSAK